MHVCVHQTVHDMPSADMAVRKPCSAAFLSAYHASVPFVPQLRTGVCGPVSPLPPLFSPKMCFSLLHVIAICVTRRGRGHSQSYTEAPSSVFTRTHAVMGGETEAHHGNWLFLPIDVSSQLDVFKIHEIQPQWHHVVPFVNIYEYKSHRLVLFVISNKIFWQPVTAGESCTYYNIMTKAWPSKSEVKYLSCFEMFSSFSSGTLTVIRPMNKHLVP